MRRPPRRRSGGRRRSARSPPACGSRGDDLPRSLVVTSAVSGEGTSTVACGLAVALAGIGLRVILVDANPDHPVFADRFGDKPGLADVLAGDQKIDDVLLRWGPDSLRVLPAGPLAGRAGRTGGLPSIVGELEERADIVLFDAPPVLSTVDTAILARACAGALLVTRYGRTRREEVAEASNAWSRSAPASSARC